MIAPQQRNNNSLEKEQLIELPKISIIVPNYNGGATIEATLQSLIEQNYPKLEIIVVDGGSTDNSVEIIKKFEPYITWWVSEKDSGQSNAINKGFTKCTGEVVNWLCSDDFLTPGALHTIGKYFAELPNIDVLVGRCRIEFINRDIGKPLKGVSLWMSLFEKILPSLSRPVVPDVDNDRGSYTQVPTLRQINLMPVHCPISQSSCFYRRKLLHRTPPLDESYEYAMDYELWSYFLSCNVHWHIIDEVLSIAPICNDNKTSTAGVKATYEIERIYKTYVKELIPLTFWHRRLRYPLERFLQRHRGGVWIYLLGPIWVAFTLILAPFYGLERVWALRWSRF